VLVGCYDETGTHSGSNLVSLCGFLADESELAPFDVKWTRVLNKPEWRNRPNEFHTYDCVHGYRDFAGWSFAERIAIMGDLQNVCIESDLLVMGSIIIPSDLRVFSSWQREIMAEGGLEGPLDYVFQYIIQTAITWASKHHAIKGLSDEPEVTLVFDNNDDPRITQRLRQLYDHHELKHRSGHILKGITFGDSMKWAPLQAADLLAYATNRWYSEQFLGLQRSEYDFPIVPGFKRLIENTAHTQGGLFDKDSLIAMVAQELINKVNRLGYDRYSELLCAGLSSEARS
jgi:Protein of unknown function (DUF3800)